MYIRTDENLTKSDIRKQVRQLYSELAAEVDKPYVFRTLDYDLELAEQRGMSEEHIAEYRDQIETRRFSVPSQRYARHLLSSNGIDPDTLTNDRQKEFIEALLRAKCEALRFQMFRLEDSVSEYVPADPLFRETAQPVSQPVGLTVAELIEAYIEAHRKSWTPKTLKTHLPKLRLLAQYLGSDKNAEAVSRSDLRHYPDALLKLRKNYNRTTSKTFQANLTDAETGRIEPSTAATILSRATGMFRWAFKKGYISSNPAEGLSIIQPKAKKGRKSRRPFKAAELERLFASPLFVGCNGRAHRSVPGQSIIKDEYFYVPIVAYYTGMRLGEIIQLHFEDCVIDGPTPHISINEDCDEIHGEDGFKHVKTEAGVRIVPLHPDLLKLGFSDFIKRQKKFAGTKKRVFYGIKFGADGQPSTVFSKWFGRYLGRIGLDDTSLVFHSFRHTAEDYLRNNLLPKYVIDQLVGHDIPTSMGDYGDGNGLQELWSIVANLKLPVRLPELLVKSEL